MVPTSIVRRTCIYQREYETHSTRKSIHSVHPFFPILVLQFKITSLAPDILYQPSIIRPAFPEKTVISKNNHHPAHDGYCFIVPLFQEGCNAYTSIFLPYTRKDPYLIPANVEVLEKWKYLLLRV